MTLISNKLLRQRPQELGKIKIGRLGDARTSSGGKEFRLPVKLSHFIVTTRHRGPDGNFELDEDVHGHPDVGASPTELAGILMYETPEENFHSEMVQYKGRSKVWSCDGEQATDLKSGAVDECKKAAGGECSCKPYARLHLQLWASPHVFGYHVFRTTGWESAGNIQSALQEIYERFGTCFNAPVKLVVYPSEDTYQEGGQEKTSSSWKVGLVLAMSMEQAATRMVESSRRMELAKSELRRLAAGVQEEQLVRDEEEAEAISDEFFPPDDLAASIETQERMDDLKAELGVGSDSAEKGDAPAATDDECAELEELLTKAARASLLSGAESETWMAAIERKDGDLVRQATGTLNARLQKAILEGADDGPLTNGEVKKLRSLIDKVEDLPFEDAEALELAIHDRNAPVVRQAIRDLQRQALEAGGQEALGV